MRALISLLLLFSAMSLGAAGIPGEVAVSDPVIQHAAGDQVAPSIASNGSGYLAVWSDGRGDSVALYATRLDRNARPLDGTGIRIPARLSGRPFVVWSGNAYVIFFTERDGNAYEARLARIDADGRVIDGPRTFAADAIAWSAASNGSRIVVSYMRRSPAEQRVTLLSHDGTLLRDERLASGERVGAPAMATNGSGFIAVWLNLNDPLAAKIDAASLGADGAIEAGPATIASNYPPPDLPLVASDGRDYLILMRGTRDDLPAVRVDPSLRVVTGPHASGLAQGSAVQQPQLVWAGGSYVVALAVFPGAIDAVRLDRDGNALGSPVKVASWRTDGLVGYPSLAANGDEIALLFNDSRNSRSNASNEYDVFAATFTASLTPLAGERVISVAAPRQSRPAVATGAVNALVAWSEDAGVYAARITPDGRRLDGRGIALSNALFTSAPDVTFDGEAYVVVWSERGVGDVARAVRIDPRSGVVTTPVTLSECGSEPVIAHAGTTSLVAWRSCRSAAIEALRVDRSLRPIDPAPLTLRVKTGVQRPAIAWNGSSFLVAWEELVAVPSSFMHPIYRGTIWAARVSVSGALLDPVPFAIAASSESSDSDLDPDVASNGSDFVVVWAATSSDPSHGGVRVQHVAANGSLLGPSFRLNGGTVPAVVWDGSRYFAAWQEQQQTLDIAGAWLGSQSRVTIAASPTNDRNVALAPLAGGRVMAAYTHVTFDPVVGGVERAFVRVPVAAPRVRAAR